MKISISVVLILLCSALLFQVGLCRFNNVDHAAHPKTVSRFYFYIGWPFTPAPAAPKPQPATPKQPPAAPKQPPVTPKVSAPPAWKPPSAQAYQTCWASLATIDRCVLDIVAAFFTLDFSRVGPDCCAAVVGVDDNCYGQMFQQFNNRYYAPALRQNCAKRSAPKAP